MRELKRLETEGPEVEEVEWEEEEWEERRAELERPASDRLADVLAGIFSGPFEIIADRLTGFYFFSGLDKDLKRANMSVSVERYLTFVLGLSSLVGASAFLFIWLLIGSLPLSILAASGGFLVTALFGKLHPRLKTKARISEVDQEIPYALRHMATQLSSGTGLPESMTSVSRADYGALSEEFGRTLRDMRAGETMTEALTSLRDRVESDSLRRAIRQIQRTLRTGGDLAQTLNILADETAFNLRTKLRNYIQSLGVLTMIYMFASAVIPALLIVLMIVMNFMGGGFIPVEFMPLLYLLVIPSLLLYLVIIFKRMEPGV
ncbi:hypothetical protein AKJ57_01935 [candidate division MSBL1 archaeon SCGC-AAA259A05]|uniref:Type II secretion system protein GspF domain-containing protein n=1 Tax=candidate division MSBL1 archaeon SCGC-AAA259A05 TaxID=1698259 RepID=A0A133UAN7_9EURY|nr:hypothetical protein AKJ57_01935 [candidate division MSBL1 archaeon SCGC-AAA259A05]